MPEPFFAQNTNMKQTIYLKLNLNNEVNNRNVTVSDVAAVYCSDKAAESKVKTLTVTRISNEVKGRISLSALKVVEVILKEYPGADVENIGECDCIIDYIGEKKNQTNKPNKAIQFVKVAAICLVVFFGSAYAIIAYNNDVGATEIFDKSYEILMGEQQKPRGKWMEIMYSVGLTGGILVFYNHFGGKSFSNDPTPIETEMNNYEKDIDDALIKRGERSGKEEEAL